MDFSIFFFQQRYVRNMYIIMNFKHLSSETVWVIEILCETFLGSGNTTL